MILSQAAVIAVSLLGVAVVLQGCVEGNELQTQFGEDAISALDKAGKFVNGSKSWAKDVYSDAQKKGVQLVSHAQTEADAALKQARQAYENGKKHCKDSGACEKMLRRYNETQKDAKQLVKDAKEKAAKFKNDAKMFAATLGKKTANATKAIAAAQSLVKLKEKAQTAYEAAKEAGKATIEKAKAQGDKLVKAAKEALAKAKKTSGKEAKKNAMKETEEALKDAQDKADAAVAKARKAAVKSEEEKRKLLKEASDRVAEALKKAEESSIDAKETALNGGAPEEKFEVIAGFHAVRSEKFNIAIPLACVAAVSLVCSVLARRKANRSLHPSPPTSSRSLIALEPDEQRLFNRFAQQEEGLE